MSPTDEIWYINKRAATAKKGGPPLSAYQRWVRGGCRGPNPAVRARTSARKARKRATAKNAKRAAGPCPKTKPSVEKLYTDLHSAIWQIGVAASALVHAQRTLEGLERALRKKARK